MRKTIESTTFYFHTRQSDGDKPAGITVSKTETLPVGDFDLTEYIWGSLSLWFVAADNFSADERQAAYEACGH